MRISAKNKHDLPAQKKAAMHKLTKGLQLMFCATHTPARKQCSNKYDQIYRYVSFV
jgi:hypothetical protein